MILGPDASWSTHPEDIEEQLILLRGLGLEFDVQVWTDPAPLGGYRLILPLVTWGYHLIPDQWQAALDRWEGLNFANPLSVMRWNTDKSYLMDVQAKGVAVVPTRMTGALTPADLDAARLAFGTDSLVIKPPVSAGSQGTHLLRDGAAAPASALGHRMMIQPEMPAISSEGEYSLFYFDRVFSHAILKSCASGEFRVQPQFGGLSRTVEAEPAMRTLAEAALAAAPGAITYARVDMVRDGDQFRLMELELIEPFLFLHASPDGGRAFVAAVQRASAG
jgi:glutathione synthase/RimK-type ligase-like ATP-grasp enzyme